MAAIKFLLVLAALILFVLVTLGLRHRRFHPGWAGLACWVTVVVIDRWPG